MSRDYMRGFALSFGATCGVIALAAIIYALLDNRARIAENSAFAKQSLADRAALHKDFDRFREEGQRYSAEIVTELERHLPDFKAPQPYNP